MRIPILVSVLALCLAIGTGQAIADPLHVWKCEFRGPLKSRIQFNVSRDGFAGALVYFGNAQANGQITAMEVRGYDDEQVELRAHYEDGDIYFVLVKQNFSKKRSANVLVRNDIKGDTTEFANCKYSVSGNS